MADLPTDFEEFTGSDPATATAKQKWTHANANATNAAVNANTAAVATAQSTATAAGSAASAAGSAASAAQGTADGKYAKPGGGIPSTDLTSAVQTSLGKADSAYQLPVGGVPISDLSAATKTLLGLVRRYRDIPVPDGGTKGWGHPGADIISTGPTAQLNSNTDTAFAFWVDEEFGITLTDLAFFTTTTPGASGTLYLGIYEQIAGRQAHASNAPIWASSVAFTTANNTAFQLNSLTVNLPKGDYLIVGNPTAAITGRSIQTTNAKTIPNDFSNAVVRGGSVARTAGAMPTPLGRLTTDVTTSCPLLMKWTKNSS